jgi:hypothetical protein
MRPRVVAGATGGSQPAEPVKPAEKPVIVQPQKRTWSAWLFSFTEAVVWICFGWFIMHHTRMLEILQHDDRVSMLWLTLSISCCIIVFAIFLYFLIYVKYVLKRGDEDFLESFPRMIQTATVNGVLGYFRFIFYYEHHSFSLIFARSLNAVRLFLIQLCVCYLVHLGLSVVPAGRHVVHLVLLSHQSARSAGATILRM